MPIPAPGQLPTSGPDDGPRRLAWQVAVEAAGVGTFDWNLVTGDLVWDDRLVALFGYDDGEDFDGRIEGFFRRIHPDDLPRVNGAIETALAERGEYDAEYRVVLPDGRQRWVAARGRVMAGPDGRPERMLGAAYDTTVARDAEARVARVLESMSTAFFLLDAGWRFAYVNARAELLLDRSRQELLGGDIWELFPFAAGSDFEVHYRAAMATGVPTSFEAYYPAPLDAWYEVQAWPGPDGLSVYFLDVTTRRAAQEHAERAALRADLLARVTTELADAEEPDQGIARLAHLLVPALADWCVVTVLDDDAARGGRPGLRDVAWAHADPGAASLVDEYARARVDALTDRAPVVRALRTGQPTQVPSRAAEVVAEGLSTRRARDLIARLAPESLLVLPMRGRGRTIGLITLYAGARRGPLSGADVDVARDVAGRAGLTLDNALLHRQQLRFAEELQRAMLSEPPASPHLRFAVRYVPATEAAQVGGDWYDAFTQPDGAVTVAIGDVVGHDVVAAAAMGQLRSMLRTIAAYSGRGPADVLDGLDTVMQTLEMAITATAVVVRLEQTAPDRMRGRARLHWSNAGHPPPVLVPGDGAARFLVTPEPDLLLGLDPDRQRTETALTLLPGDTLLLYTDGLVERRDQPLDAGMALLQATLAELATDGSWDGDLDDLCDRVLTRMVPDRPQDDVALIALRVQPS